MASPTPEQALKALVTLGLNDELAAAAPILAALFAAVAKNPTDKVAMAADATSAVAQLAAAQAGVAQVAAGQLSTFGQAILSAIVTKVAGDAAGAQATLAALVPTPTLATAAAA